MGQRTAAKPGGLQEESVPRDLAAAVTGGIPAPAAIGQGMPGESCFLNGQGTENDLKLQELRSDRPVGIY